MQTEILDSPCIRELFGSSLEWVHTGYSSGVENMQFDEDRVRFVANGEALPMLRVYGWNPWAVSLGANQKESDIDHEERERRGFDIVRRATGGRAVLHADELTYSIVTPLGKYSVHEWYRSTHEHLLRSLQTIVPSLDFEKSQPNFRELYRAMPQQTVACFASSARYEIMHDGRKVVGSAQRVIGNTLLQHGSILLGAGGEQLADISKNGNSQSDAIRTTILAHSSTLSEAAERVVEFEEVAEALRITMFR
jgi:lipoate-protein ligase A